MSKQSKQQQSKPAAKAANPIPPAVATAPVNPSPAATPAATDLPVDTVVLAAPAVVDGDRPAASEEVLGAAPNIGEQPPAPSDAAQPPTPSGAEATDAAQPPTTSAVDAGLPPADDAPLLPGGPTLSEYIKAGYRAENYPPKGYAPVPEPEAKPAKQQMDGRTDLFGNPSNYKPLFGQGVPPGSSIL